ncbi:MAG: nucleotidyltransferase domain-containing protein [Myxococcaceae bacterium]|nr:nucleotidyltransferase domain-containing protein [Myxococcaceae bacterium]
MDSRPSPLDVLDGAPSVLPHGAEVTTRVERLLGERRLPPGLVGRVTRARDGGYDVQVLGLGEVWFRRDELLPRREGQAAFAVRRETAWSALRQCAVLEATVGSRAWGLADATSDTDVRGAFLLPFRWTAGLVEPPRDLVSADGSHTFWEVEKTIAQALRADPNTLELLFVPSVRALDEVGEWLLSARHAFVSKQLFGSFGRYALRQLDSLTKSARLAAHRDTVLDWLRANPALTLDDVAARLADLSPREHASSAEALLATKTYLKQLYRSLADQGFIAANDFASLKAWALAGGVVHRGDDDGETFARRLSPRNAYNLLRLIHLATGWLRTGAPSFEATGALRARLLDIKGGGVPLSEVLAEAEALAPALEAARDTSPLPDGPDLAAAHGLLQRIAEVRAARWLSRAPGPWGHDAPPAPAPASTDPRVGP